MATPQVLWRQLARRLRTMGMTSRQATAILVSLAGLAAGGTAIARWVRRLPKPPAPIALSVALQWLREKRVQELIYTDGGALLLHLKRDQEKCKQKAVGTMAAIVAGARYATQLVPGSEAMVFDLADKTAVPTLHYVPRPRALSQVMSALLPVIFLIVWYKVAKSLISRDEKFVPPPRGTRIRAPRPVAFADVVCKNKVELVEIVDYLNHPERYREAGARMLRGALLVGPSGTGKTLLARAVAEEANCRFISASASEFVEVYVGRGAARVRDLFRQARESTPAVLFIDELDALGSRTRSMDGRGANEEYIQTLNQFLTELDGFHGHDGVVVLAATNRQEAIDPALLRPGRFDRHVYITLPDEEERLAILQIHAGRAALSEKLDPRVLEHVAAGSAGFSGAELANVVNEAVYLALRAARSEATAEDFLGALDRQRATRQMAAAGNGSGASTGHTASFSRALMRAWPAAAAA